MRAPTTVPEREPVLRAIEVSKSFDVSGPLLRRVFSGQQRSILRAVDDVSFEIPTAETFSLVGESGCGKSTVARLVVGLHHPDRGRVVFEGSELTRLRGRAERRRHGRFLQMIFQDPYASLNPRWRVFDIVAEPIRAFDLATGRRGIQQRVDDLLTKVGLNPADASKHPHEFSGGQRQRIGIARALALNPRLIVADEPVSALDVSVQAQIVNLLADLRDDLGLTYVFIAHDLSVVRQISTRIAVMYLGGIVETGPTDLVLGAPRHHYTAALRSAVPIPDLDRASGRRRIVLKGDLPSPLSPPAGCRFHTRCASATALCKAERPALAPLDDGRLVACHHPLA